MARPPNKTAKHDGAYFTCSRDDGFDLSRREALLLHPRHRNIQSFRADDVPSIRFANDEE